MKAAFALPLLLLAQAKAKDFATTKEAMRPIQILVGQWRVFVEPEGGEKWSEEHEWEFKIEKDDYALQFKVADGKLVKSGVLSYDLKKKLYRLELDRSDGKRTYEGHHKGIEVLLEELTDKPAEQERVTYMLLRDTRHLISIEKKLGTGWAVTHQISATNKNLKFVKSEGPKCVVTGGAGSIEVQYQGKSYYVC